MGGAGGGGRGGEGRDEIGGRSDGGGWDGGGFGGGRRVKPLASAGVAVDRVGGWWAVGQAGVLTLSPTPPVQVAGAGAPLGVMGSAMPNVISPLTDGMGAAAPVRRVGGGREGRGVSRSRGAGRARGCVGGRQRRSEVGAEVGEAP